MASTQTTTIQRPTIKGVFVNSHVRAVRRKLGEDGVEELERRLGRPVDHGDLDDVLVADEVSLIETALDLTANEPVPPERRAFEAGRLHYRNFTTTPWAKILFGLFPSNFRFMMRHTPTVAERVFRGVTVSSKEVDERTILVRMGNNDYPIEHFQGLFTAWLEDFGHTGRVIAQRTDDQHFEYLIQLET